MTRLIQSPLTSKAFGGTRVYYRPDTSDERVLSEMLEYCRYRRASSGFDVEKGESWLDLGANIGGFAIYARLRHAKTVTCYECDNESFQVLTLNVPKNYCCINSAVTNSKAKSIDFYRGRSISDYTRFTCVPSGGLKYTGKYPNSYGGFLRHLKFDGVKMDIEGAEGGLLDDELLPQCNKLVLEYHLSRDPSIDALKRRIAILKSRFKTVIYPPEFERLISKESGGIGKSYYDRHIWCMK